jgi:uncharacterized protein YoxC
MAHGDQVIPIPFDDKVSHNIADLAAKIKELNDHIDKYTDKFIKSTEKHSKTQNFLSFALVVATTALVIVTIVH